jgi:hypothetical protein
VFNNVRPWINLMQAQRALTRSEAQKRFWPSISETKNSNSRPPRPKGPRLPNSRPPRPMPSRKTEDSNSRPPRPKCPRLSNSRPPRLRPGNLEIRYSNSSESATRSYPFSSNVDHLEIQGLVICQPEFKIQMTTAKSYLNPRRSRNE